MNGDRGRVSCLALAIVLGLAALVPAGLALHRTLSRAAPAVTVTPGGKAIGIRPVPIEIEASEPRWGVRSLRAVLVQGEGEHHLGEMTSSGGPGWRLWARAAPAEARLLVEAGRSKIEALKEGEATIRVEATNGSWAGFGDGRTTVEEITLPVLLTPPRVQVLSSQHYINQGGSECVLYRVSGPVEASGVRLGELEFPGFSLPGGAEGTRFALFAFPHDTPASVRPVVFARDAAGNESSAGVPHKVFPKSFRRATIELSDGFLGKVVPEIQANTPSLTSRGDLLEDFLEINGRLRRENAEALVALAARSRPEFLWRGAFTQLGGSQVMASFADDRTYRYRGESVDRQTHLGFDLAVTANHPVDASNDGLVVMAGWFGIYGNTVVIDHGYGLMTLYSHLSSIDVAEGQSVRRGEVIGRSGQTGLAAGDHLHFSVLLQGIPVSPAEWWDAHWIRDRIESKIGPRS